MLDVELQHVGISSDPDEVDTPGWLLRVRAYHTEGRRYADPGRNQDLIVKEFCLSIRRCERTAYPHRPHCVALQRLVDRVCPVSSLLHEDVTNIGRSGLDQTKGVPLVSVRPRKADVREPTLFSLTPPLERIGYLHRHLHARREDAEPRRVYAFRHEEPNVERIERVQNDADGQNVGAETTAGDGSGGGRAGPARWQTDKKGNVRPCGSRS